MEWFGWMAGLHGWALMFAVAAAALLPFPLTAAQRPGRMSKPWWTASRYLAWVGLSASLFALATGQALAKTLGLLEGGWILRGEWSDLRMHQYLGGASVFFGYFCIRALYVERKEHQGLGPLALVFGLVWALTSFCAGRSGFKIKAARDATAATATGRQQSGADEGARARSGRLFRILDYASLTPIHAEPVRSPAHGNRWVRAWVSGGAAEPYAKGERLPDGSLAVLSSVEDRWGRPTFETGPLYYLEVLAGGRSRVGVYWANVPEPKRAEFGGLARVNLLEPDERLKGCLACHANGPADAGARSRTRPAPQAPRPPSHTPATSTPGGAYTASTEPRTPLMAFWTDPLCH